MFCKVSGGEAATTRVTVRVAFVSGWMMLWWQLYSVVWLVVVYRWLGKGMEIPWGMGGIKAEEFGGMVGVKGMIELTLQTTIY